MNRRFLLGLVLGLACIGIIALSISTHKNSEVPSGGKISVTTSFYPLYFFASQIGGDKAVVSNLTPAGAEPHEYEPTAQDIVKIQDSSILVLNGGGLEAWASDVQKNIEGSATMVVSAGEGLTDRTFVEDGEEITDPHVWLSPPLAEKLADKIAAAFTEANPANASYYASNASVLKAKLASLDAAYKTKLASCKKRDIVTSHAAFGYLAAAYNLRQVPITGVSPDAEPSLRELADLTAFAKNTDVKYIFFESLVSPKLAETLAREIGAQTLVLNPLEGLTSDEIAAGKTYFTEMEENLKNLETALECTM